MMNLVPSNPLENITRIEYHGQPVLTTAQLAEYYETSPENIKRNFSNNADRFVECKHYFKVEGEDLDILRGKIFHLQISPKTRTLYLWTKYGCLRHCKSIGTDKAWDVFETLEETYFNVEKILREQPLPSISGFQKGRELGRLAAHADDPYTKRKLVAIAANLILGREEFTVPAWNPAVQLTLFK